MWHVSLWTGSDELQQFSTKKSLSGKIQDVVFSVHILKCICKSVEVSNRERAVYLSKFINIQSSYDSQRVSVDAVTSQGNGASTANFARQ